MSTCMCVFFFGVCIFIGVFMYVNVYVWGGRLMWRDGVSAARPFNVLPQPTDTRALGGDDGGVEEAAEAVVADLLETGEAEEEESEGEGEGGSSGKLDRHGLPVELRMDDYDDEEEVNFVGVFW